MKYEKFLAWILAAALTLGTVSGISDSKVFALVSDDIQSQIDEMESKNQKIQDQLSDLENQDAKNSSDIEDMVAQKSTIDQQISLLYQQIQLTNEQISKYSLLIADKQAELDVAQKHLDELTELNHLRIRAMEENGPISYWSVLFKANNFSDFLDRLNMVQEIAVSDYNRIQEMNKAANAVKQAQQSLEADRTKLENSRIDQENAQSDLEVKRGESEKLLADLVARGDEFEALIASKREKMNALLSEIAQKEVERTEALQAEWEAAHPTQPETEPDEPDDSDEEDSEDSGSSDAPSSSGWLVPCDYVYVSSPFSEGRMHPILGYVRPHHGVDLAADEGTPVHASRSGYVTVTDYEWDGAGNYVFINHGDGFSSVYMHMDSYIVEEGQYVSAGETIGYVGTTGMSTGPHLHFGIMYDGTYYNPADYIDL